MTAIDPNNAAYWAEDFVVSEELKTLLALPGFLKCRNKGPGQRARDLYARNSLHFSPFKHLTPFGMVCFIGHLEEVKKMVNTLAAPPLDGTETAYEVGYASIVIWGSQRIEAQEGQKLQHLEVLKFLIERGAPVNQRDIMGYTPVHHYLMNPNYKSRNTPMLELLLKAGANPNAQDKVGAVPILAAFEHNYVDAINLLMDHNANLDIKDGDNISPMTCFIQYGPIVTAAVEKGLRKRKGEYMPMEEKKCEKCGANDKPLKACAACRVARYCSTECQRTHWKDHKAICRTFTKSDTVTVKPYYDPRMALASISDITRKAMGTPANDTMRRATAPKGTEPKTVVVKIQVPNEPTRSADGSMLVYTKKRTELNCLVRRGENVEAYDRLYQVIKEKGVNGLKAYMSATIHNKDKLEIKISEVLAPQPF